MRKIEGVAKGHWAAFNIQSEKDYVVQLTCVHFLHE